MRSMRTWIIALAVAIATAAGGIAVPIHSAVAQTAQTAPAAQPAAQNVPLVIGTLDVQAILTQSKAGQSLEAAWNAKSKAINADIGQTEQNLRAKRQQLEVPPPPAAPLRRRVADARANESLLLEPLEGRVDRAD